MAKNATSPYNVGLFLPGLLNGLGISVTGIVHVGAHKGEEIPYYQTVCNNIVVIEPQPDLAEFIRNKYPDVLVHTVACSSSDNDSQEFYMLGDTELASLKTPIKASKLYEVSNTITVPVRRLSSLIDSTINVGIIDVQGSELDTLRGTDLVQFDLLVVEARNGGRYIGAANCNETMEFMCERSWCLLTYYPHGILSKANVFDLVFVKQDWYDSNETNIRARNYSLHTYHPA